MVSCKKKHHIDYLFDQHPSGWYLVIFEDEGSQETPEKEGRYIYSFGEGRIFKTSSSPSFEWGEMRLLVNATQIRKGSLLISSYVVRDAPDDRKLKFQKLYFGDDIEKASEKDVEKLLNKALQVEVEKKNK